MIMFIIWGLIGLMINLAMQEWSTDPDRLRAKFERRHLKDEIRRAARARARASRDRWLAAHPAVGRFGAKLKDWLL